MIEASQNLSRDRKGAVLSLLVVICRAAARIARYSLISVNVIFFFAVLVAWGYGLKNTRGFSISDSRFRDKCLWNGDEKWLLTLNTQRGWFCAAFRAHTEPKLPITWKCGTLLREPIQDAKYMAICPGERYSGLRMPIRGEWAFRFQTKDELPSSLDCRDEIHPNRTEVIWDYSAQPPTFLSRDALKRQTPMRKHIDVLIGAPFWLIALISGALPAFLLRRFIARLRRHRFGEKECSRCGYDLTGNISGTCPECGTSLIKPTSSWPPPLP